MSNNIKTIRAEKAMSQKALANAVGVSQPYLHDLENGARGAKAATWEKIAEALGVPVDALMNQAEKGA